MKQIVLFAVVVFAVGTQAFGESEMKVIVDDCCVKVQSGEARLLSYRYGDVPFKPYADKLLSPSGVNILRDAPHDHLHHHALMLAFNVDGKNYWEEHKNAGTQRHLAIETLTEKGAAGFTERIDWVDTKKDVVALEETRKLLLRSVDEPKATLLTWESALSLPKGKDQAVIEGGHYHGLGMRFIESMDKDGVFFNADGADGKVVRGDEKLTPSRWCAYTAEAEGHRVTVAMFDHPSNPRPVLWFTMHTPFAYLSATMNYWKEPLTLKGEAPMVLRYGVALLDGKVAPEEVESLYKRWLSSLGERPTRSIPARY